MPTNNALHAVLNVAKDLPAQEVILGASNMYSAEEQLDQIALYWINLHHGEPQGVTVHIVSADRAVTFDLHGGNRIPRAADRQAKTVADLRAAGIGIRRVLLVHDGTLGSHDVFEWMLTMIAADVHLDLVPVAPADIHQTNGLSNLERDRRQAEHLNRKLKVLHSRPQSAADIVRAAHEGNYNLLVLANTEESRASGNGGMEGDWASYVLQHSPCGVFMASDHWCPRRLWRKHIGGKQHACGGPTYVTLTQVLKISLIRKSMATLGL